MYSRLLLRAPLVRRIVPLLACALYLGALPQGASAADGATLVLREGQIVRTNFGFKEIAEAFKKMPASEHHKVLELTIEGGSFLINLADVAIVCRDDCPSLQVEDPRQTNRNR